MRFNPFTAAFRSDPYASYRQLRDAGAVHWGEPANPRLDGSWYVLGHAEVSAALGDARLGRSAAAVVPPELLPPMPEGYAPLAAMFRRWLVFTDPPDHTRLRRLVQQAFTPRAVEALRPRITAIAHALLDAVEGTTFDLVSSFALPLPLIVIAEMLGVDPADRVRFARWSAAMSRGNNLRSPAPAHTYVEAGQAALEMRATIAEAAAARRRAPRDDLLTALVRAEDDGQRLTEEELLSTAVHLLTAGHETVVNLIAKGTLALARAAPDGCTATRALATTDLPSAVEELIRFDGPVQLISRWALADLDVGGHTVTRGQPVVLALGAANRDPAVFARPDTLDLARFSLGHVEKKHLGFGAGIHLCLGAALARLEARIAFETLWERMPTLRVPPQTLQWGESVVFHGLEALLVERSS